MNPLGVGVVGAGLIGTRRAAEASHDPRTQLVAVADVDGAGARELAQRHGASAEAGWRALLARDDVAVVVVATPNAFLAEIAIAAMRSGKDVLVEKPMGRSLVEAERMAAIARETGRKLKVGFNHRYHPAITRAHVMTVDGTIGRLTHARVRYGHGGRPGYEREWRGDATLAGGGELTDQGVHVLDLLGWFLGTPQRIYCVTRTAVWPLGALEDNAFALLTYPDAVAQFHSSWTQWKNLFSFEVFGTEGSLAIEGLGRSYGAERLIETYRRPEGGVPRIVETTFPSEDDSWRDEWNDFVGAIRNGTAYWGTPDEGLAAMRALDAAYRSAGSGEAVALVE